MLGIIYVFSYILPNVLGKSEVPSVTRNLDGALVKSDMHLLGEVHNYDSSNWEVITRYRNIF